MRESLADTSFGKVDTPAGRRYIESPENGWRFFLFEVVVAYAVQSATTQVVNRFAALLKRDVNIHRSRALLRTWTRSTNLRATLKLPR